MDDLEEVSFKINEIKEHTTNNDNDCVIVKGDRSYDLWVFNEDWMDELIRRKNDYLNERFDVIIEDKTDGTRNHVWAHCFWPKNEYLQKVWFEKHLQSRGIELKTRSDEQTFEKTKKVIEQIYPERVDELMSEDDIHNPSEDPGEKPSGHTRNKNLDRQTRIERQASLHFASRIVAARIESGDIGKHDVERASDKVSDEAIAEEINKWARKFKHGIHSGQLSVGESHGE